MNCEDFESNVSDLAREQMMEASVRARALAHRDKCEACARRLEDERALSFKLRALAADTNSAKAPALGNELLVALRSRQGVMSRSAVTSQGRYWVAAAAAVAAMILVVLAVPFMRSRWQGPSTNEGLPSLAIRESAPPAGTPIAPAPDKVLGVVGEKPGPREGRAGHDRGTRTRRSLNRPVVASGIAANRSNKDMAVATDANANSSTTEIATDFMPVGYASAASMQDGGQLVRVELPRSALVAFGLPMNVNRYNEKVKADVFFGADGMARAIRFVQ